MSALVAEMAAWLREQPAPAVRADQFTALKRAFWLADSRQIAKAIEFANPQNDEGAA